MTGTALATLWKPAHRSEATVLKPNFFHYLSGTTASDTFAFFGGCINRMFVTLFSELNFRLPEMPPLPVDNWWFLGFGLFLLIVCIWLVARLVPTGTSDIDPAEIHRQMLTTVRELHSQGELTPEEYRSIKGHLVERLALQPACTDPAVYSQDNQHDKENNNGISPAAETDPGTGSGDAEPTQNQCDTTLIPQQDSALEAEPEKRDSDL